MAEPVPPLDTSRPFLRRDGLAAGIRQRELDGPGFHRLLRGTAVRADRTLTPGDWARAAILVGPSGAVVSHQSAAQMWGGVVPPFEAVHLTVDASGARPQREGVIAHRSVHPPDITELSGLSLTTPEQTFADLARRLSYLDTVVLGDSLVAAGATTPPALVRSVARMRAVRPRRAAAMIRAGVESPKETWLRLLTVLGGMPEPAVNLTVLDEAGHHRGRLDLAWKDILLGAEYDGRQHAEDPRQWQHDIRRREGLESLGWRLVLVTSHDVQRPAATLRRLCSVARSRGMALAPDIPTMGWKQYL